MEFTLQALSELTGAELRGDPHRLINHVATLQDAEEGAISFLANKRYRTYLDTTRASAVILAAEDAERCNVDCLVADNPYLAHARVVTALYPPEAVSPGAAVGAFVHDTATVADSAHIGVNSYVGANVVIEDDVVIGPGCVLLDRSVVGAGSRLVAMVTLGSDTQLGKRCLIHPGAVIGGDGFGLANDDGAWVKVPQIGRAVLGDDVEVGSCSSIDRGAIGDTVLQNGVKIDSQVHVAHNVYLGEHTAMAGRSAIAGSSHIGAYCTIAGGAGVTGHVELVDHVHVSGVTSVTRSIKKPGVYTGTIPAMEHAVWLKNFARLRQLDDMVRRIKSLEQEVAALREQKEQQG
ncbi:UDP-3-O-(3-hydroxymyristoyl)glucosamine N-acyltransferase [Thiosocius teredinicola]|uniref:UDP-3-O-(3-hydroxymyristoyl)glucosamine N-acyltransferase n=1 Tax=Thiosocius teredinicola TaxID=1973002 RepID=UPI000990A369